MAIKKKEFFNWLGSNNGHNSVTFVQEAHCDHKITDKWTKEWGGPAFYSHGSSNKCGVITLIGKCLEFKIIDKIIDDNGRLFVMQCSIQGEKFVLVNSYAPNTETEQLLYWDDVCDAMTPFNDSCSNFIWGGDLNCCLTLDDADGGKYNPKVRSISALNAILADFDLCDIWRIRNPHKKQYTWRTFNPRVQRRLDYFLISDRLQSCTKKI